MRPASSGFRPGKGAGMKLMRSVPLLAALAVALVAPSAAMAETSSSTLVVDRDRVQCGNAGFTSIQAAVDAARPGDQIRVCPDLYPESVTVDIPLTLWGDPDAVEAVNCFDPTPSQPGDLDPAQQVVVDPPGDDFTTAFALRANDIVIAGFVIQGASVGVDASDTFSGSRIHHDLFRLNTLFAVDSGSEGSQQSRTDHNCIRQNRYGLVSELDNDAIWVATTGAYERAAWNARDLRNARIDHNQTYKNGVGVEAGGPGRHDEVTFDHNVSRADAGGIGLLNSTGGAILDNEITLTSNTAILIGGDNSDLTIASNLVTDGGSGIVFAAMAYIDKIPAPSRNVLVAGNTVLRMKGSGIIAAAGMPTSPGDLHDSVIADNVSSDNAAGVVFRSYNTGNEVRNNVTERNTRYGIYTDLYTAGNLFDGNRMLDNALDAGDKSWPANTWTANQCVTDDPAGMICGAG
ncbi:hypothetical protein DKL51_30920 [Micromonospora globispora]|nr:hypothetical protein DKL51_30920 [Micromonospora globispora]